MILAPSPFLQRLQAWVATTLSLPFEKVCLSSLSGDAGNRQYWRVITQHHCSIAVYDGDIQQRKSFLQVHALLTPVVTVPTIFAIDDEAGFLLLEDFGDCTYEQISSDYYDYFYKQALTALIGLQQCVSSTLPVYDGIKLIEEMRLFEYWYCRIHHQKPLVSGSHQKFSAICDWLVVAMGRQPKSFVHRDYHSRNLMCLPNYRSPPGILDFQDAVTGAITYDVVSLLKDAYQQWSIEQQRQWLRFYWQQGRQRGLPFNDSFTDFWLDFNVTAIQRGLKVLGIFSRLAYRDGRNRYLTYLPTVYRHLQAALASSSSSSPLSDLSLLLATYPPTTTRTH